MLNNLEVNGPVLELTTYDGKIEKVRLHRYMWDKRHIRLVIDNQDRLGGWCTYDTICTLPSNGDISYLKKSQAYIDIYDERYDVMKFLDRYSLGYYTGMAALDDRSRLIPRYELNLNQIDRLQCD